MSPSYPSCSEHLLHYTSPRPDDPTLMNFSVRRPEDLDSLDPEQIFFGNPSKFYLVWNRCILKIRFKNGGWGGGLKGRQRYGGRLNGSWWFWYEEHQSRRLGVIRILIQNLCCSFEQRRQILRFSFDSIFHKLEENNVCTNI